MLAISFTIGLMTTHIGGHNYNEDNNIRVVQIEEYVVGRMTNSYKKRICNTRLQ